MILSIILPVYNQFELLKVCMNSILSQTFRDYQLLLIDDGSDEAIARLCDEYARQDSRILLVHQNHMGVSAARNAGIVQASGDYIFFMDNDDYLPDPGVLARFAEYLKKPPRDLVFIDYTAINQHTGKTRSKIRNITDRELSLSKKDFLNMLYDRGVYAIAPWQIIVRRQLLIEHHIRYPEGMLSEDCYFNCFLLYHANTFGYLPSISYIYRRERSGALSTRKTTEGLQGIMKLVDDYTALPDYKEYMGIVNIVAHMYGFLYYPLSRWSREMQNHWKAEMMEHARILLDSNKWNHHLIYWSLHLVGYRFVILMVRCVYLLYYKK